MITYKLNEGYGYIAYCKKGLSYGTDRLEAIKNCLTKFYA